MQKWKAGAEPSKKWNWVNPQNLKQAEYKGEYQQVAGIGGGAKTESSVTMGTKGATNNLWSSKAVSLCPWVTSWVTHQNMLWGNSLEEYKAQYKYNWTVITVQNIPQINKFC